MCSLPAGWTDKRVVVSERHEEKWVQWKKRPTSHELPPWPPPAESHAKSFFDKFVRAPLLWLPLCPLQNVSSGAEVEASSSGMTGGVELGLVSDRPLAAGRLMIAPTWLASLGTDPDPDWSDASPPPFSYLHLTNMWHCFPHMCWCAAALRRLLGRMRCMRMRAHARGPSTLHDARARARAEASMGMLA